MGCSVEVALWAKLGPEFCSSMIGPTVGKMADVWGHRRVWRTGVLLEIAQCVAASGTGAIAFLLAVRPLAGVAMA